MDNTLRSPSSIQEMTSPAMLKAAIAWTLCCQTPVCPGERVIHLTNTLWNLTLAITWLSCYINSSAFGRTESPLETCQPASHTHGRTATACRRTVTPHCGTPVTSTFPAHRTHVHNYAGKHHHDPAAGYSHIGWTRLLRTRGLLQRHRNHH